MQANALGSVPHKKKTFGETFCGADRCTYKWAQTITDLDLIIPVNPEIASANDVDVKTTPEKIQIRVKPRNGTDWSTVLDGEFMFKTKTSEMMWSLERGKHINVHIEKAKERWWESLLKDEPKINLEEYELSRPVTDLSEEEEMTLHKIWSKQLEKRSGSGGHSRSQDI